MEEALLKSRYVVMNQNGGWQIRNAHRHVTATFPSKAQALCAAIELAEEDGERGHAPEVPAVKSVLNLRRGSAIPSLEKTIASVARERDELLEQQSATADLLGIISRSKFELRPVLQTVVDTAVRLCRATSGEIFRLDSGV